MADKNQILQRIKDSVSTTAPGAMLILYGSYARGEQKAGSDIDLLVLVNQDSLTYDEEKKIKYPLYHIEYETGIMISPLVFPKKIWETKHRITPFYENVIKEGVVLSDCGDNDVPERQKKEVLMRLDA